MRKSKCDRRAHDIANAKAYGHYLAEMTLFLGSHGRFMMDRLSKGRPKIEINAYQTVDPGLRWSNNFNDIDRSSYIS